MKNAKLNWVRLPIKSLENCRELGGYSTEHGQQTKWHSFLRSSEMSDIDKEDIAFLKDYGVKTIIDLRRQNEIEKAKNPLSDEADFDYYNIPFITKNIFDITQSYGTGQVISVENFYIELLKQTESVKRIFETIYHAEEGCIVFHCRVGKDRTGVLAMLLLGLAGVEKKDIIGNYEVSYTKLESLQKLGKEDTSLPLDFLYSNRDYIIPAYDYIMDSYGNFEDYFITIGLDTEIIEGVKGKIIQDYTTPIKF